MRYRPGPHLLTVAVAAALLAGCATTVPGWSAQPTRSSSGLHKVLQAWAGFPVTRSPRPLVLAGPAVVDPGGFPTGGAKLAYQERAVSAPTALPAGPARAAGYPLVSAAQALTAFMASAGQGPPVSTRLTIAAVRLGTGMFQTDRGLERLPAWLFAFTGVPGPAAVLAVAPARVFGAPRPAAGSPFVRGARLRADGRTLTVEFTGSRAGTGHCTADYRLALAGSASAVAVAVAERDHDSGAVCALVAYPRQVTTVLPAPLGTRVLVDAATGTAVPVTGPAGPAPGGQGTPQNTP